MNEALARFIVDTARVIFTVRLALAAFRAGLAEVGVALFEALARFVVGNARILISMAHLAVIVVPFWVWAGMTGGNGVTPVVRGATTACSAHTVLMGAAFVPCLRLTYDPRAQPPHNRQGDIMRCRLAWSLEGSVLDVHPRGGGDASEESARTYVSLG